MHFVLIVIRQKTVVATDLQKKKFSDIFFIGNNLEERWMMWALFYGALSFDSSLN